MALANKYIFHFPTGSSSVSTNYLKNGLLPIFKVMCLVP